MSLSHLVSLSICSVGQVEGRPLFPSNVVPGTQSPVSVAMGMQQSMEAAPSMQIIPFR